MNTQDNELDELFRARLNGLEAEPSVRVWESINQQLSGTRTRKKYAGLLGIAASIAVLITAALLLMPGHKKTDQPRLVSKVSPVRSTRQQVNVTATTAGSLAIKPQQVAISRPKQIVPSLPRTPVQSVSVKVNNTHTANQLLTDSVITDSEVWIARTDTGSNPIKATMPDIPIQIKSQSTDTADIKAVTVLAANTPATNSEIPRKSRRIHGLGGFINAVVATVDKREDKLIEFTDTDEGDSVTGINLGIFKIKKQK